MTTHITTDWHGLYAEGWTGEITPAAMAHPAKYARALIRRIYDHLLLEGLVKPGDRVIDCFGGVALGALDAMRCGLDWTGCELEPKFVALGQQNIALWNARYASHFPGWGRARLLGGDSRPLAATLASASALVSSPSYADQDVRDRRQGEVLDDWRSTNTNPTDARQYGAHPGNLGSLPPGDFAAAVASPPYAGNDKHDYTKEARDRKPQGEGNCFRGTYSRTLGQIGDLPTGDFAATLGSPPFSAPGEQPAASQSRAMRDYYDFNHGRRTKLADNMQSDGNLAAMPTGDFAASVSSPPYNLPISQDHNGSRNGTRGTTPSEDGAFVKYGSTRGQLEGLPPGDFDAAVSSPPYENSLHDRNRIDPTRLTGNTAGHTSQAFARDYGDAAGQLGKASGDTFWTSSRAIVEQVRLVLSPGGVAVWVVKDYVRAGRIVPFAEQWRQLCEAVGFCTLHVHRAWLVEDHGAQHTIFGEIEPRRIKRISFFRRLAEKRGAPEINWETVICMQLPPEFSQ